MYRRSAPAALQIMNGPEDHNIDRAVERLRVEMERGFGALRAEMEKGFGGLRAEMEKGFGALRSEMIDRDATLLKWFLIYSATQIGVITALLALFR